ncbi:PREDICTED: F-box protein At4g00893-like [Camelina sativa]|uniref:F-box protein At4g00893-like n=1 Tax=Camelina sativa TaxID=90675 RepID=A0ABM1QTD8_CAMSA|nr:PREDICTED: F-box protein At4g00893-like [Camelina sativa]
MTDQREKLILSNEDVSNNGQEKKVFPFADLPSSLLELIMCCLVLRDNIRASAVCKAWRKVAEAVRIAGKHPWVITFRKRDDLIVLYDPMERKRYTLNLPELAGTDVCYSKDGWLLMRRSSLVDMFFFNPYTRELIDLPKCELSFQAIAFSSTPTSGTCVVVALRPFTRYNVRISICYPGATEWANEDFSCSLGFDPYMHSNLVYANGHFYCFSSGGVLVDFDLASRTVSHQVWSEHRSPYIHSDEWFNRPKRIYLTEQKGELFLMYTCSREKPMVYKLVSSNWEEMGSTTLDGVTIFASMYSSETRVDVLGMRNNVYFPKYGLKSKTCTSYSFDEGRYHKQFPKVKYMWQMRKELCPLRSLWIEPPPKNV